MVAALLDVAGNVPRPIGAGVAAALFPGRPVVPVIPSEKPESAAMTEGVVPVRVVARPRPQPDVEVGRSAALDRDGNEVAGLQPGITSSVQATAVARRGAGRSPTSPQNGPRQPLNGVTRVTPPSIMTVLTVALGTRLLQVASAVGHAETRGVSGPATRSRVDPRAPTRFGPHKEGAAALGQAVTKIPPADVGICTVRPSTADGSGAGPVAGPAKTALPETPRSCDVETIGKEAPLPRTAIS